MKRIDLTGKRFERWTVISYDCYDKTANSALWTCCCDCGVKKSVNGNNLKQGKTRSCGCLEAELMQQRTIPFLKQISSIHHGMMLRCYEPKSPMYYCYGGRGIVICEEWKENLRAFHKWAINNSYKPGLQINRIDNDKNYCPDNCNWISRKENMQNTRRTRHWDFFGDKITCSQLADRLGKPYAFVKARLYGGNCRKRTAEEIYNEYKQV